MRTLGLPYYRIGAILPQSAAEKMLLTMIGLPILDGVFASAVTSHVLETPAASIGFGLTVFSGPGTMAAIFALQGGFRQRFGAIIRTYGLVWLVGVLPTLLLAEMLRELLLPNITLFSALVLFALALQLGTGAIVSVTDDSADTRSRLGSWMRGLVQVLAGVSRSLTPQAVVVTAVGASLLNVRLHPESIDAAVASALVLPSFQAVAFSSLAFLSGLGLTVIGLLCSATLNQRLNMRWVRAGGAAALVCIAALILHAPILPQAPLIVFCLGLVGGLLRKFGGQIGDMPTMTGGTAV